MYTDKFKNIILGNKLFSNNLSVKYSIISNNNRK